MKNWQGSTTSCTVAKIFPLITGKGTWRKSKTRRNQCRTTRAVRIVSRRTKIFQKPKRNSSISTCYQWWRMIWPGLARPSKRWQKCWSRIPRSRKKPGRSSVANISKSWLIGRLRGSIISKGGPIEAIRILRAEIPISQLVMRTLLWAVALWLIWKGMPQSRAISSTAVRISARIPLPVAQGSSAKKDVQLQRVKRSGLRIKPMNLRRT